MLDFFFVAVKCVWIKRGRMKCSEYDARWKWFSGESGSDDMEGGAGEAEHSAGEDEGGWRRGRGTLQPPAPHFAPQLGHDGLNLTTGDIMQWD